MSIEESAWGITVRLCETCNSAPALLYCRPESIFLCKSCDAKLHHRLRRHDRVWLCDVCEQEPAIVTCKADSAALCFTCDRDIHSANPLASRHERRPVSPFYDTAESSDSATNYLFPLNPNPNGNKIKFCSENLHQFMDFDSVVPVQQTKGIQIVTHNKPDRYFELDFTNPNGVFNQSMNPSVSSTTSCLDTRVVPDGSSMSTDTSYSIGKVIGMGVENGGSVKKAAAAGAGDREARVQRYREKRKNRRFEKMIRYASRKAYAESRPRIKGRFVKQAEVEQDEMKQMLIAGNRSSAAGFLDLRDAGGFSIVPSFSSKSIDGIRWAL